MKLAAKKTQLTQKEKKQKKGKHVDREIIEEENTKNEINTKKQNAENEIEVCWTMTQRSRGLAQIHIFLYTMYLSAKFNMYKASKLFSRGGGGSSGQVTINLGHFLNIVSNIKTKVLRPQAKLFSLLESF